MDSGNLAFVSGASRGIGAAIMDNLKQKGYRLIGTATTENGVNGVVEKHQDSGLLTAALKLDVMKEDSINSLFREIELIGEFPSIIINNAGITRDNLMLRMKSEEWFDVINANLNAVYRLSKYFLRPMLKARFGRIINITSVVGSSGNAGQTNYAASKAGLLGMTKSLAQEVANRGVTVNAVSPGFISTDMTEKLTENQKDMVLSSIPMRRAGTPSEVASIVAFLVSAEASYVTGETIHVNGGMYMS
jgi:3-oxoacyl-[acyl-carrier protein] reductase